MKFSVILITCFYTFYAQAISFQEIKDKFTSLFAKKESLVDSKKFELPEIPSIKKSSTDTAVFDKSSKVFQQGEAFHKQPDTIKQKYHIGFLREIYPAILKRDTNQSEFSRWLNILEQQGTREAIYQGIVASEEYYGEERRSQESSAKLVQVVQKYAERFLALHYNANIKSNSPYTLKKEVIQRTLDVLEHFARTPDKFYRWYAVFSSEIAEEYPSLLRTEIRTNKDALTHYKWAETVPFDHVQSEVIIKLSLILNHFI